MRGSPSAPLVAVGDRLNDWTPRLFPRGKSLNRKSWCCTRPNTWLMEPCWLPSKVIENQSESSGRLAMQDGFSNMGASSEKTSEPPPTVDCDGDRSGVKGQNERHKTAPLTPPRSQQETVAGIPLTSKDAVIHGAQLQIFQPVVKRLDRATRPRPVIRFNWS